MKKIISLILIAHIFISSVSAENEIKLEGIFQGENLFVMNPFAATGVGFCIYEVTVNGQITTDEINSSAFEIDLSVFQLKEGDPVTVVIKHKDGCNPKVLNPDVLKPRSTFNIVSIKLNKTGILKWTTTGEKGSLPFIVEQFKWKKWTRVAKIKGKGTPSTNTYTCNVNLHSGTNKFRVKQIDYSKRPRYSPDVTYRNLAPPVKFTPGDGQKVGSQLIFSRNTAYEVYDYFGKLRMKGAAKVVDIRKLPTGQYFLNYDNASVTFEKR